MEIDYKIGSKEDFYKFVEGIGLYDKVAILTHVDLDGLASGLFLEEILNSKGIKVDYLDFLDIKSNMVSEISMKLKEEMITKIFFCDINVESIDSEGFEELRREKDVFLIDHHPMEKELIDTTNIIKTGSRDCSGMTIFDLGEGIIDREEWDWLVCSTIFSDYSFIEPKNFEYLKEVYPEVTIEDIASSTPGMNARRISSALIYYKHDIKYVYEMVKERKMSELSEVHELIEEEVDRLIEDFSVNKEYFAATGVYFYEVKSRFDVLSYVTSLVSKMHPKASFVFMYKTPEVIKFSARSTDEIQDMSFFMKRCVYGLEGASGGGHKAASAAKIRPQDLDEFMKRLAR